MRNVTLTDIYQLPFARKYLKRAGLAHAITVAKHAYHFASEHDVNPDLATKAALLHDIGHYTWYRNGKWDYNLYKQNDIHAIKGAERAHKMLIRLGENPVSAKEIAVAILFHTDSYFMGTVNRNALQEVVAMADEADEEPGGNHHYKVISEEEARNELAALDHLIEQSLNSQKEWQQSV
ncbi:HD domain-containing protein [Anaerobacillus sp. 1_MG-2023]|uniref:HD domain-containing protein n=1 Tax=Bacillales TaxID=1385 RepID=UPI0026E3D3F7|nr:HD domain-containing protein [Anaerobacillus sp. 1_MG-2023]MDO6657601.1 HD domain-containing protein [Anaerobacillus sp. 1_MG-2023]